MQAIRQNLYQVQSSDNQTLDYQFDILVDLPKYQTGTYVRCVPVRLLQPTYFYLYGGFQIDGLGRFLSNVR